jgi:5-methylthioadenosine/S-adenosylhomocysteine deaminase
VTEAADLVVHGVTAITMDPDRRILENAWIAVSGDRIAEMGVGAPPPSKRSLTGRDLVAIPGLIDAHAHAGHGLIRAAGGGDSDDWFGICQEIYARHSPPAFWRAEARLVQLERLLSGVTTGVSLLGGGGDVMRTDTPDAGDAHCAATMESGLRTILAVGPSRLPFPKSYRSFHQDGQSMSIALDFDTQLAVSADLIARWNDVLGRRTGVCLAFPVYRPEHMESAANAAQIRAMTEAVCALRAATDVILTQDGHRAGSIAFAREMGLLGPHALLSHCVDLTEADMTALVETGASVAHNPSAIMSILHRCPAPELIDRGVTVCVSSDAAAPDRGYDMFRHMALCMHYHRRHFRDPNVLPEGKVLAMATIDAAQALGLQHHIGSLEAGKKADIVLVDMHKPHLYPPVMPVTRLTHFAGAADVDTVIVDGRVLMVGRRVEHLEPDAILSDAAEQAEAAFVRAGLVNSRVERPDLWGA